MLSENQMNRFGGVARLYGVKALEIFSRSNVCVIGVGGVGSWTAEALARSGVGKITLVDLDELCITNVNRQLHAMDGQIGRLKIQAMAERIKLINPECEVICEESFFSKRNSDKLLSRGFDFVIDAIDHINTKLHLISECRDRQIPIVVCGAAGGLRDATKVSYADLARVHNDNLLKQVRTYLRTEHGFPKGTDKKIRPMRVECVFSTESPVFPNPDGTISDVAPADEAEHESMRLNCASGYGSITHLTATVGFVAAERCLHHLSQRTAKELQTEGESLAEQRHSNQPSCKMNQHKNEKSQA